MYDDFGYWMVRVSTVRYAYGESLKSHIFISTHSLTKLTGTSLLARTLKDLEYFAFKYIYIYIIYIYIYYYIIYVCYVYTYIHTYIHTYIYTYIHTQLSMLVLVKCFGASLDPSLELIAPVATSLKNSWV